MAGEDLLIRFYYQDGRLICEARGGPRGPLAISVCSQDFTSWVCYMNTKDYSLPCSLGNLMRWIPIPMILQQHRTILIHASQIALNGRGILFTAPSGTGKSTQAKLWRDHRGARIICNDRTLIHDGFTYGYPMDGSEPVCSGERYQLGAIVVLGQSPENTIQRLKPRIALANLMPQLVFHSWDPVGRNTASAQLIDLMMQYPVYQLNCTPDEAAVACLENRLKMDGVI